VSSDEEYLNDLGRLQPPTCADRCRNFWEALSLGKYHTKFYHGRGKDSYSSICGGLTTVICGILFILLCIWVLIPIFLRVNYNLTYYDKELIKLDMDVAEDGKVILIPAICTLPATDCVQYSFSNLVPIVLKDTKYIIEWALTEKDEAYLNCSKLEFHVLETDGTIEGVNNTIIISLNGTYFTSKKSERQCSIQFDDLLINEMF